MLYPLAIALARFPVSDLCHFNNNLQALQLIILARYLLGVPKP